MLPRYEGSLYLAAFSNGKVPQRFGQSDHDLCLYDSGTGAEIMRLDHGFPVNGLRGADFSRNGRWLALLPDWWLGGDLAPPREIQLWDTREKRLIEHIPYASDFVPDGVTLRADGQQLVAWEQRGQLACWDRQKKGWRALSARTSIKRAVLSADGKYLAICGDGNLTLWDMARDQSVYSIAHSIRGLSTWDIQFSAGDTMLLAVCHNKIQLWPLDLPGYLNKPNMPKLTL